MFRVVLIAYLNLTTVIGPALCCCNAKQLVSMANGSKCCGKPAARRSDAQLAHDDGHDHHDGHAHHRHEHLPAKGTKSNQAPVPHEHGGQNCPCGKHHANLVAAVTDGVQAKAVEMQNQTCFVLVSILPVVPEFDVHEASINAHRRPADLYGTEILRAYQILRC
jgi:hypothetical protein